MIKINTKEGKNYASIEDLFRWDKNPKIVLKDDFERLKRHLTKFGQFKPIVITEQGEVIGGNSRFEALKEMEVEEVWVSIVNPKDDSEKVEIALADNDEVGKYVEEELAQIIADLGDEKIELKDYKINTGKDINLEDLINKIGPAPAFDTQDDAEEEKVKEDKFVTCPKCGHDFSVLREVKDGGES